VSIGVGGHRHAATEADGKACSVAL
jgi:hypothetical protein